LSSLYKTVRRTNLRDSRWAKRSLFLWACSFLLLAFAGSSAARAGEINSATAVTVGPGPQFAIADFDGDRRPDVASIEAGQGTFGTTSYWIQFQLSAAGRQSIRLFAPAGGLRIEARDVNGDHAVDLVFTTAWLRQPVAILLNDGHGVFSQAEPTAFPGAFSETRTNWVSGTNLAIDIVGVPPQSGAGIDAEEKDSLHERSPGRLVPPSRAGFPTSPSLYFLAGRAPPSEAPYL
jgi:hypothetical protein